MKEEPLVSIYIPGTEPTHFYLSNYNSKLELFKSSFIESQISIQNILSSMSFHSITEVIVNFLVENIETIINLNNNNFLELLSKFKSVTNYYIANSLLRDLIVYIHCNKQNKELQFLKELQHLKSYVNNIKTVCCVEALNSYQS